MEVMNWTGNQGGLMNEQKQSSRFNALLKERDVPIQHHVVMRAAVSLWFHLDVNFSIRAPVAFELSSLMLQSFL